MQNVSRMGERESLSDFAGDPHRVVNPEPAVPMEPPAQRLAFEVGHHEVRNAVCYARIKQRHDVRMDQRRDRLDLTHEALRPGRHAGTENLHGDETIVPEVSREIDDRHPAPTQLAVESERALGERGPKPLTVYPGHAAILRCDQAALRYERVRRICRGDTLALVRRRSDIDA